MTLNFVGEKIPGNIATKLRYCYNISWKTTTIWSSKNASILPEMMMMIVRIVPHYSDTTCLVASRAAVARLSVRLSV